MGKVRHLEMVETWKHSFYWGDIIWSATWLFVPELIHANNKETIKDLNYLPFVKEIRQWPIYLPHKGPLIARFMGTCGPPGADRTQVGPMLAPWNLLSKASNVESVSRSWRHHEWGTVDNMVVYILTQVTVYSRQATLYTGREQHTGIPQGASYLGHLQYKDHLSMVRTMAEYHVVTA